MTGLNGGGGSEVSQIYKSSHEKGLTKLAKLTATKQHYKIRGISPKYHYSSAQRGYYVSKSLIATNAFY